MAGKRVRALSLLGMASWLIASCTSTPDPSAIAPAPIYEGLNAADIVAAERAIQEALETLPSNQRLEWDGTDGVAGVVRPLRTFKIKTGHFCRDFAEVVRGPDSPLAATGRACRSDEGRWLRVPGPQALN